MAKQPVMINRVIELLDEGKTPNEIIEETRCSKSTVTVAKKKMVERQRAEIGEENDEAEEPTNDEMDTAIDSFIKNIKINPDTNVIGDDEDADAKEIEYQCPKCDAVWSAGADDRQDECPECGEEFE